MNMKTAMYLSWVTAVTVTLSAISFIMLALSLHHSTRSAAGQHAVSNIGMGFHDGDI